MKKYIRPEIEALKLLSFEEITNDFVGGDMGDASNTLGDEGIED